MRSLAYLMVRSAPFETPPTAAPQDKLARLEPRTTELQPIRNPPGAGVNLAECACAIPPCNPAASAATEILEQSIEKSWLRERWLGRNRGDADLRRCPFEVLLKGAQLSQRGGYVDAFEAGALVWHGRAVRIGSETLRQA